jgi:hypothetical protein
MFGMGFSERLKCETHAVSVIERIETTKIVITQQN